MSGPSPDAVTRRVRVIWYDERNPGHVRTDWVRLTEGYSDETSIPRILAIARLGGLHEAEYVTVGLIFNEDGELE